ncbi:MAG: 4Fe-4S dicluster domain-containing protein, partial [bacterium]
DRCAQWLNRLSGRFDLFIPVKIGSAVHWHRFDQNKFEFSAPALREIRAAEPIKPFFFSPRERVAAFPEPIGEPTAETATLLFGVKSCDLRGLSVHKNVFLDSEFEDPFYKKRLENTIIVAADCPEPKDSCFCNLVGLKPYAVDGADLALTVLDGGWVIEVFSEKGMKLVEGEDWRAAEESQLEKRNRQRDAAEGILQRVNPTPLNPNLPKAIAERTDDEKFWTAAATDCVECFGCLTTCPTCFCFLLYDQAKNSQVERIKVWDVCYLAMYARVGGGANPRAEFVKRFINRFHCKFMHAKNQHGFYFCSGCGRCFTSCMGKIDIRRILGRL